MKPMILAMTLAAVTMGGVPAHLSANEGQWHKDYEAARALARRTGKPLFLVFR